MPSRSPPPSRWFQRITRLSVALALVAMGVTVYAVGVDVLLANLREIGAWFGVILAIEVAIVALDASALHALACNAAPPYLSVLQAQVAGRAVNAVTPTGSLGEATKVSLLARGMSSHLAIGTVLSYDLLSATVQLTLVAIGAPLTAVLLHFPPPIVTAIGIAAAIAGALVITLVVLAARGPLVTLIELGGRLHLLSSQRRRRWHEHAGPIDRAMRATPRRGLRRALLFVIASQLATWAEIATILAAAGVHVSLGHLAALGTAGVVIGWMSSLVPLGLGVAESGNYALFSALGMATGDGVTLALARRVSQLVIAALGFALLGAMHVSTATLGALRGARTSRRLSRAAASESVLIFVRADGHQRSPSARARSGSHDHHRAADLANDPRGT